MEELTAKELIKLAEQKGIKWRQYKRSDLIKMLSIQPEPSKKKKSEKQYKKKKHEEFSKQKTTLEEERKKRAEEKRRSGLMYEDYRGYTIEEFTTEEKNIYEIRKDGVPMFTTHSPSEAKNLIDERIKEIHKIFERQKEMGIGEKQIKTKKPTISKTSSNKLNGLKLYITGEYPGFSKEELKSLVEKNGGLWKGMSQSLELLVIANNPGEVKIKNASQLGIKMMKIDEFLKKYKLIEDDGFTKEEKDELEDLEGMEFDEDLL